MSRFWDDAKRQRVEPWRWWITRHHLKLFLIALLILIIF